MSKINKTDNFMRMEEAWKKRLLDAINKDGRSDRAISLAAGVGQNFVNQLRNEGKASKLNKVLAVIAALDCSLLYIFTGAAVAKIDEDLLLLLASVPEEAKVALLQALQAQKQEKS